MATQSLNRREITRMNSIVVKSVRLAEEKIIRYGLYDSEWKEFMGSIYIILKISIKERKGVNAPKLLWTMLCNF